jgi:hypothetical protein
VDDGELLKNVLHILSCIHRYYSFRDSIFPHAKHERVVKLPAVVVTEVCASTPGDDIDCFVEPDSSVAVEISCKNVVYTQVVDQVDDPVMVSHEAMSKTRIDGWRYVHEKEPVAIRVHPGCLQFLEERNTLLVAIRGIQDTKNDKETLLVLEREDAGSIVAFETADCVLVKAYVVIADHIEYRMRQRVFVYAFRPEISMIGFFATIDTVAQ